MPFRKVGALAKPTWRTWEQRKHMLRPNVLYFVREGRNSIFDLASTTRTSRLWQTIVQFSMPSESKKGGPTGPPSIDQLKW